MCCVLNKLSEYIILLHIKKYYFMYFCCFFLKIVESLQYPLDIEISKLVYMFLRNEKVENISIGIYFGNGQFLLMWFLPNIFHVTSVSILSTILPYFLYFTSTNNVWRILTACLSFNPHTSLIVTNIWFFM